MATAKINGVSLYTQQRIRENISEDSLEFHVYSFKCHFFNGSLDVRLQLICNHLTHISINVLAEHQLIVRHFLGLDFLSDVSMRERTRGGILDSLKAHKE